MSILIQLIKSEADGANGIWSSTDILMVPIAERFCQVEAEG